MDESASLQNLALKLVFKRWWFLCFFATFSNSQYGVKLTPLKKTVEFKFQTELVTSMDKSASPQNLALKHVIKW